ncbi:glycosyltransferase family 4 protein [Belliella pelovolcani]|uniref:glycosyltransferase family 4 protein n=1 Tax=Belliella pelovolcani TaxID=529505 RepID=UPI003918906B
MEFKILYGEKKSYPLIPWLRVFFQSCLKVTWTLSMGKVQQGPPAYGFDIPANRRIPDKLQIKLEQRMYLKAYRKLVLLGWVPDLIHAQSGMDAGIYAHHISNKTKIPFVIIEHQVFVFHYYSKLRSTLILDAFQAANKTAAVSIAERRQVLMNQPNCNPVIIPNLVDESKLELKKGSEGEKFRLVTFMYANQIKGYDTFFRAIYELQNLTDDFNFTVVGNGQVEGRNIFQERCQDLGILEKAELIPKIEREKISDFFQNFDLYVCSSDFETFGIAPREAMMCGLPVVTTSNGGVEDSILPETGLVVSVGDPKHLADGILRIKRNFSSYHPKVIRELAVNQYGRDIFINKMKVFYV